MIDRYSITASHEQLSDRFTIEVPEFYKLRYNASPTQLLPIITSSSPQGISTFYWGTAPDWAKNKVLSEKIINTRAEQFQDKPTLRKALKKNRCVIPADGFYTWKKIGKKTSIPYRFVLNNNEIFALAGIWEEFEDTDGNQIQTFSMITTESNATVANVYERMPLILSRQFEKIWLSAETEEQELLNLITSKVTLPLNYYPVSPRIGQLDVDVPSLILPTPPSDQHGNLTLFD